MTVDLKTLSSFRGEIVGNLWPGVTEGAGQTQATRQATATALQAAMDAANAQKKVFILEPGTYEIEVDGGLKVPLGYNGFIWRGSYAQTIIKQFAVNTPVLVIGDESGGNSSLIDFEGVSLSYGVDQTGQTGAIALKLAATWRSRIAFVAAGGSTYKPYDCCKITGGSFWFQNTLEHCTFGSAQHTQLHVANSGTGNKFSDLYLVGKGAPAAQTQTGSVLSIDGGGSAFYDNYFERVNIEWAQTNQALRLKGARGVTFIETHFEGVRLQGSDPCFVYCEGSDARFLGINMLDNTVLSTDSVTGTPSFFKDGWDSTILVDGLRCDWVTPHDINGIISSGAQIDVSTLLALRGSYERDVNPLNMTFKNVKFMDSSNPSTNRQYIRYTYNTSGVDLANLRLETIGNITEAGNYPVVQNSTMQIIGDATMYGFQKDPYVKASAGLSADITLTLSNKLGPSGSLAQNIPCSVGQKVVVYRKSGTPTNNLIVKNHDGTTISTISTANVKQLFYFDGTDWVLG